MQNMYEFYFMSRPECGLNKLTCSLKNDYIQHEPPAPTIMNATEANENTIIVVEDSRAIGEIISLFLKKEGYRVLWLASFKTALDSLKEISLSPRPFLNVCAIIFDHSLDNRQPSVPLVELVSASGFSGPMIANSTDERNNRLLQQAGCTHVPPDKSKIVPYILELLKR